MFRILIFPALLALILLTPAEAHHSVLNYDGKVEVKITGTVTSARFGYPHSIYRIDVADKPKLLLHAEKLNALMHFADTWFVSAQTGDSAESGAMAGDGRPL